MTFPYSHLRYRTHDMVHMAKRCILRHGGARYLPMSTYQHYALIKDFESKQGRVPGQTWGSVDRARFNREYDAYLSEHGGRLAKVKNRGGDGIWFDTVEHKTAFLLHLTICINTHEAKKKKVA